MKIIKLKNIVVIIKIKGKSILEKEGTQIQTTNYFVIYDQERRYHSNLKILERQIKHLNYLDVLILFSYVGSFISCMVKRLLTIMVKIGV